MEAELDDLTRRLGDALDTKTPLKWKLTKENPPTTPPPDNQNEDDFKLGQCEQCGLDVKGEASVVKGLHYHPKCFTCDECKRPIGSEKYFVIKGKKYCQNDKHKHLDKCAKCGKPIEENAIRNSTGETYHADCFTCAKCQVVLNGRYFNVGNDKLCEDCFEKTRDKCYRCSMPILEASLTALERIYHPDCFKCSMCPKTLQGRQFFITEDTNEPICKDDFEKFVAKSCNGCKQPIVAERYVSLSNGENFHQKCYSERDR